MYKAQKGRCAICDIRGDIRELGFIKRKSLCVDHDHDTQAIRGLLCGPCNLGIGSLADDPVIITKALKYLKKHKRKSSGKANERRKKRGSPYPSRRK
jgi:hypothetical protein